MAPCRLKRYLCTKHSQHERKNLSFFQRNKIGLELQRLDCQGNVEQQNKVQVETSKETAFKIFTSNVF